MLWGYNVGLHVGLNEKPVLDLSQCVSVTRYEDGSFVCDPDGEQKANTSPLEVGENSGMQKSQNEIQNTISGNALQPARGE